MTVQFATLGSNKTWYWHLTFTFPGNMIFWCHEWDIFRHSRNSAKNYYSKSKLLIRVLNHVEHSVKFMVKRLYQSTSNFNVIDFWLKLYLSADISKKICMILTFMNAKFSILKNYIDVTGTCDMINHVFINLYSTFLKFIFSSIIDSVSTYIFIDPHAN